MYARGARMLWSIYQRNLYRTTSPQRDALFAAWFDLFKAWCDLGATR